MNAAPAWRRAGLAAALVLGLGAAVAAPAGAACRQALALGLDISGSVDASEYRLQLDGLALALLDSAVQEAFLAVPGAPVRLAVFEWAGPGTQRMLVPWRDIAGAGDLQVIADTLMATGQRPREVTTALGRAMLYGAAQLQAQADCWRLTLDISGDGQSNNGPRPRDVQATPALAGITINGLVIGVDAGAFLTADHSEIGELTAYFRSEVIRGPAAFVEAAIGYEQFQQAMERKLLKELQTLAIGTLEPAQ